MKKRHLRGICFGFLFCLICVSINSSWSAEAKFPSRPIEIYIGFEAGGQTDLMVRALAKALEKHLGVTVVPINKPGGGGVVANTALINSRPDGYTMANTAAINIVSPLVLGQATYTLQDLRVIGQYSIAPNVISVSADSPWKTFREFLDYEKKNPGVKYGHPGIGSGPYLMMENLKRKAGLKMVGVPFKGDPEVLSAVLGNHVSVAVGSLYSAKVQEEGGKMRILFSFEPTAKAGLGPSIPDMEALFGKSVAESHIPVIRMLIAPGKTPNEIIQVLEQALEKTTKDREFISAMDKFHIMTEFAAGNTIMQKLPVIMSAVKEILKP